VAVGRVGVADRLETCPYVAAGRVGVADRLETCPYVGGYCMRVAARLFGLVVQMYYMMSVFRAFWAKLW